MSAVADNIISSPEADAPPPPLVFQRQLEKLIVNGRALGLRLAEGQFDITTAPGHGTEIRVRVPMTEVAAEHTPLIAAKVTGDPSSA